MAQRHRRVERRSVHHRRFVEQHSVGVVRRRGSRVASLVGATEEHHRPRQAIEHVAEVFGTHHRVGHPHDLVGADHLAGEVDGEVGGHPVVDGDRIAIGEVDRHAGIVGGGDPLRNPTNAVANLRPRAFADRADRRFDRRRLGDHVVGRAGGDPSNGDHGWIEDVDGAGDHHLQRLHDLARDGDRVQRVMRRAGVAAATRHHDLHGVGRRHDRAALAGDPSARQEAGDVQRVGTRDR